MRFRWVRVLGTAVAIVAVGSIALGLAAPDGVVRGDAEAESSPSPSASPTAQDTDASVDRAPESVAGLWPGRPPDVREVDGSVDWCPVVDVRDDGAAERFGGAEADEAACAAVDFILNERYSRLAVPKVGYTPSDFVQTGTTLTDATRDGGFADRVSAFVADPSAVGARQDLGLVLFAPPEPGDEHTRAGQGHVFYGPAGTDTGYVDRAVWIDPTISTVVTGVDRSTGVVLLSCSLTATAALPVYSTADDRDDMAVVPTTASVQMQPEAGEWKVAGWTIRTGTLDFRPLKVADAPTR